MQVRKTVFTVLTNFKIVFIVSAKHICLKLGESYVLFTKILIIFYLI